MEQHSGDQALATARSEFGECCSGAEEAQCRSPCAASGQLEEKRWGVSGREQRERGNALQSRMKLTRRPRAFCRVWVPLLVSAIQWAGAE